MKYAGQFSATKQVTLNKKKRNPIKLAALMKCLIGGAFLIGIFSFGQLYKKMHNTRKDTYSFAEIVQVKTHDNNVIENAKFNEEMDDEFNGKPFLTAYIETTDFDLWEKKPFPKRGTKASDLEKKRYYQVNSCSKLTAQLPVDNYPETDPFLPWIHDVFPSDDGNFIRFVAQNKRRCNSGKKMQETKKQMQPQLSLFQSVPIKRVSESPTRYRLSSYEDADVDAMETRFICRFKPSMEETLSTFPVNYDYHTYRKGYKATFTYEGFDNHMIWSSQMMFDCPVPPELRSKISDGSTVIDDYASLFVDLIPIRTPVRYGSPVIFLPPRYEKENSFDTKVEWGDDHILPLIEDSGRWENIPICKPTLQTYGLDNEPELEPQNVGSGANKFKTFFKSKDLSPFSTTLYQPQKKIHDLVACTWASTSFSTRGNKDKINDGKRRLYEWLTFHFLAGFDHIYIYDNSGAFTNKDSLKSIIDLFPGRVTRIDWPSKICNNRQNNVDNKGERSSQYAAETSCRLRFGAHSKWIAAMDTDEYLIPVNKYTNMKDLLNDVEKKSINILSFHSQRARPRFDVLKLPENKANVFDIEPKEGANFLEAYNCHRDKPRTDFVPAEKQIYRSDYVLLHHVHYSTMTMESQLAISQTRAIGNVWKQRYKERYVKFIDEDNEGLMLHSKSVVSSQTRDFQKICSSSRDSLNANCKLGFAWPNGEYSKENEKNADGYRYNCFVDERIENNWVPKLKEEIRKYPDVTF